MQIDALTLSAIADELRATAMGARIEDVIAPTPHAVALQLYAPGLRAWLMVSAHPQVARIHLVEGKPRKLTNEPSSFVMLLRKHLEGARIVAVRQPTWERVIELGFARGSAGGEPVVWLVVEMMGRRSNLILRDETGAILGALLMVSGDVNRYRAILPHAAYREPPPQTRQLHGQSAPRLAPETITGEELRAAADEMLAAPAGTASDEMTDGAKAAQSRRRRGKAETPTVASLLAAHVAGWSRELGREAAARALGEPDAALKLDLPWDATAAEVRSLAELAQTHAWRPTLVSSPPAPLPVGEGSQTLGSQESASQAQGVEAPVAFAVYVPRQYLGAHLVPMPSVNALLAAYFEGAEWRASVEGAKGELRHSLQTQRERCTRKEQVLHAELAALDEAAQLREEADILLAFQTEVPAHATSVTLPNPFAPDGSDTATATLALDPRFSAVENANRRYNRYHKLQRATQHIPEQLTANTLELARIAQLTTDLDLAETSDEIAHVRRELVEAGYLRGKSGMADGRLARNPRVQGKLAKGGKGKPGAKPGQAVRKAEGGAPLRRQSSDGFTVLVGKNSRQNEEVAFHQAASNDLWLHARGVPGAHVIVKSGGRAVPETTIRQAAALAAYYSQARAAGTVPVDVTEQRYVRHIKGGGPGMVTYERERTLYVAPAEIAPG